MGDTRTLLTKGFSIKNVFFRNEFIRLEFKNLLVDEDFLMNKLNEQNIKFDDINM